MVADIVRKLAVLNRFCGAYRFGGRIFATTLVAGTLALTTAHVAPRFVLWSLVGLLPLMSFLSNLGKLRLYRKVRIRTGFGTVAVSVVFVTAVAELWNFRGGFIGTWYIWLTVYGRSLITLDWSWCHE